MARRKTAEQIDAMIERFQAQDAQEAPVRPADDEQVMLVKKTWLYGAMIPAGSLVTVPTTIANVLRAKGIVK